MKADPAPDPVEMIEMIDDNGDPFSDRRATPPSTATTGGSRWIGPAAAAVLLAVVGYGVVSSTIQSHKSSSPTPPQLVKPQFYVASPPAEFHMYLAEQRGDGDTHAA
ncbi:MAG TPA: hypothetical protein VFE69_03850, partial [Ilumatobacteraceae bacterium]|nr:hypothetical protein [Ilumatobacteraceae bacterium]